MVRVVRPRSTQSSPDGSIIQARIIMADTKTDSSSIPLSDDPANPTKGLSAKPNTASHPAGAEPALDTLLHRTSLRFCCAANVVTAGEAREPDAYRDSSNRLLCSPRTIKSISHAVRSIPGTPLEFSGPQPPRGSQLQPRRCPPRVRSHSSLGEPQPRHGPLSCFRR